MSELTRFEVLMNQVLRLQQLEEKISFNSITDDSYLNQKLQKLIQKRIARLELELSALDEELDVH
jgi:predicted RNA-binding protein